jgi:hypothetical protein
MSLGGADDDQQPSASELALAQQGANDWNNFILDYSPVEDDYLKRIADYKSGRYDQMAAASSEAAKTLSTSPEKMSKLKATGMPGNASAILKQTMSDANVYRKGLAGAAPAIEGALTERDVKGRLKLVATERGLQDQALVSLGDAGRRATEEAINASEARSQSNAALLNAAGTVAGAAASPYIYKNRMEGGGLFGVRDSWAGGRGARGPVGLLGGHK